MLPTERDARLRQLGLAVLSVLLVGSLWVVPYLPTNDGPQHVLSVHMEAHYSDAGSIYPRAFEPALQFASRGFTALLAPLESAVGWKNGLRVALSLTVLLEAWGFVWLVGGIHKRRAALAFLGFPLALTWELYMGFLAFVVGSGIGLWILGLAVRWREPSGRQRVVLAGLLLLQSIAHVFSATLTFSVVGLLLIARAPRERRVFEIGRVAVMGLPTAGILFAASSTAERLRTLKIDVFVVPFRQLLATFPRIVAPGPSSRAVIVTVVAILSLAAGAVALVRARTRALDETSSGALSLAAIVLILLGAALPLHMPGWQYFSPRFVPLAVALAIATIPLERVADPKRARLVAAALFACAFAWLATTYPFHKRLGAAATAAIAGLDAPIKRSDVWIPFIIDPYGGIPRDPSASEVPYLEPLVHIAALYATVEGGVLPYTFASSSAANAFVVRRHGLPPRPLPELQLVWDAFDSETFHDDLGFRHGFQDGLANAAMSYEGVLLVGARPDDIAQWKGRGFRSEWESESVFIGHFEPCSIDVQLPPDIAAAPLLDVGVQTDTLIQDAERPVVHGADGLSHQRIDGAPCGYIWVKPHGPEGATGAPAIRCSNAEPTGEIRVFIDRTHRRVQCLAGH